MEQPLTYSSKKISIKLIEELQTALKSIDAFGSVEIYVQNSVVTQITVRNIKKTTATTNILKKITPKKSY